MKKKSFWQRAKKLLKKGGWQKYRLRIADDRRQAEEIANYQKWILANRLTETEREKLRRQSRMLAYQPLISILVPVYNVEEKWLRAMIESVLRQIYENWELCLADDASPAAHVRKVLEEYAAKDQRIKVVFRETNGHISNASNSALEMASGEFAALLDHDDELTEDALFRVAEEINRFPNVQMLYSDEDMMDETQARFQPKFKPDFSRELFYSVNYVTHLAVYRTDILREIGGFRVGLEGSQDYDLALRVIEQIPEKNIRHIPRILYHWRAIQGSVALSGDEKPYAHERAREAIRNHFERIGKNATVSQTVYNLHRVRYDLPTPLPKISLILLAGKNLPATLQTINLLTEKTDYENLEFVVVCPAAFESLDAAKNIKFIVCAEKSEAAKYNAAVGQADGDVLCFLNETLLPLEKDWLRELAGFAVQPEIGAVGAKILTETLMILHAGIVLGFDGLLGAAHGGYQTEFGGNLGRALLVNNSSAVAIDCFVTRREIFLSANGFDEKKFPNKFYDIDFCLRLREKNLRVVLTPHSVLLRTGNRKTMNLQRKPLESEVKSFKEKWSGALERDPFYNPNFSLRGETFRIDLRTHKKNV